MLLWATRGRTWGFRFLWNGGLVDPLPLYDSAFAGIGDEAEAVRRAADTLALRFPDPNGREDVAGRVIPHEFVASGPWVDGVDSVEAGRLLFWPLVEAEFARVWNLDQPPPPGAGTYGSTSHS